MSNVRISGGQVQAERARSSGSNPSAASDGDSAAAGVGKRAGEAVSEVPPESVATPELIRQTTVQVLSERIRLLGSDRSGAYEHYSECLQRGFPIPPYEVAILKMVRDHFPDLRSYHEIGSGMGTLPLMLARDGFTVVGVERDERRHLTATTIARELARKVPHIESGCRFIGAEFPDAVADLDLSNSMAILTDFVSTRSPQEYVRLCKGLADYRYVLIDLQRFCEKRTDPQKQKALIEELAGYGLTLRAETIDVGSEGYYRLFDGRPQVGSRSESPGSMAGSVALSTTERAPVPVQTNPPPVVVPPAGLPAERKEPELARFTLPPLPHRVRRARFGGWLGLSALIVIGIPSILATIYYGFVASNQYVTTFQFAVRGPSLAATSGASGGGSHGGSGGAASTGTSLMSPDAFVITDYVDSQQAISDVEHDIDVQAMYSKPGIDFWARLRSGVAPEELRAYWSNMVWAHFDLVSGNVTVSVRTFEPQDSLKLAQSLVSASKEVFRRLNMQAQQDFVRTADENLASAQRQLAAARSALVAFREKTGFVEPDKTASAGSAIIDDLRKQLATAQSQYTLLKKSAPRSPLLPPLDQQMSALEEQIRQADQTGYSPSKVISPEILGRYQSLDLDRVVAEKRYADSLDLRTQAYLMAQSQQSYLEVFVQPTLPRTSLYPERVKSIASIMFGAAAAWFIGMLLTYAVRDHLI